MLLTEEELQIEQTLLREQLKAVNKNLDRIVKKEMIFKQSLEGKERAKKQADQRQNGGDIAHEVLLIEKQIENNRNRKSQLKLEWQELKGKV
jgi:hypothetical protein